LTKLTPGAPTELLEGIRAVLDETDSFECTDLEGLMAEASFELDSLSLGVSLLPLRELDGRISREVRFAAAETVMAVAVEAEVVMDVGGKGRCRREGGMLTGASRRTGGSASLENVRFGSGRVDIGASR
jgi:hypothetical protein